MKGVPAAAGCCARSCSGSACAHAATPARPGRDCASPAHKGGESKHTRGELVAMCRARPPDAARQGCVAERRDKGRETAHKQSGHHACLAAKTQNNPTTGQKKHSNRTTKPPPARKPKEQTPDIPTLC